MTPINLCLVQYTDESGAKRERLMMTVGTEPGKRSFFYFPGDFAATMGLREVNRAVGQQLANLLDGVDEEG